MAAAGNGHDRSQSGPRSQEYPLQHLTHPEETYYDGREWGPSSPMRTLSERGHRLLHRNERLPHLPRGSYSPIADSSGGSVPPVRPQLRIINSDDSITVGASYAADEGDDGASPLGDGNDMQTALIGLGMGEDPAGSMGFSSLPRTRRRLESIESFPALDDDESRTHLQDEDTAPLTANQEPPGMLAPITPRGQRRNKSHNPSHRVSFISRSPSPNARLGDDLEANRSRSISGSRHRSLSPSTPLHRAGTMVRKMSQRIVNISNEPELADSGIRRRLSYRQGGNDEVDDQHLQTDGTVDGTGSQLDATPHRPEPSAETQQYDSDWFRDPETNPFKGYSLGIFPPDSLLRARLCDLLIHPLTEPFILLLIMFQTILLAIQSAQDVNDHPRDLLWTSPWMNFALLALFIAYSAEIVVRVIVSGFVINPVEYSTIDRGIGWRKALSIWFRRLFALPSDRQTSDGTGTAQDVHQQSIMARLTEAQKFAEMKGDARQRRRMRLAHRAFLRHSFTRLDFLAVVSFWISFFLAITQVETKTHVYTFDMLSSLRILRLLSLTSGTTIILRSLKKAAPLLLNVALLIGFFWLLFAIIGVQSFKSSLQRYCVWQGVDGQSNYTLNSYQNYQFCGGSLDANGTSRPWYEGTTGAAGGHTGKGYLCPPGSLCIASANPYNGTVSFDNIFQSLELVFVIMTGNTYTDLMYYLADSDYLIVCLFFAAGIVVMTFWLMNLLIAVITSSFQVIREESATSAFADQPAEQAQPQHLADKKARNVLGDIYGYTKWLWLAVIVYGLVAQALRSSRMTQSRADLISYSETGVTLILLFEILFRFVADFRGFFKHRTNMADLFLAVITSIMQIPAVHNSGQVYAWLTFFQIARIYRVVLAVPLTRELILLVLGNMSGLLNLILFVFLLTFLAAIFAAQLFRGTIPPKDPNEMPIHITFSTIWNSFLGMYQILSSENWTILLYNVTQYNDQYNTAWMGAIFLILWFILAFFIVLNMFIAVIQENFDVSEDEKRIKQFEAFLQRRELGESSNPTLSLSTLFKPGRFGPRRQDPLDYGPAVMEQLLKGATVQDFVGENFDGANADETNNGDGIEYNPKEGRLLAFIPDDSGLGRITSYISKLFGSGEPNPFYARLKFSANHGVTNPHHMAKAVFTVASQRKQAQRDYLERHPMYNVSLFIFKPDNNIRRLCQKIVGPGRGSDRIEGASPSTILWYAFSTFLYAVIVAMVLLACVTTPQFQKEYFKNGNYTARNWFTYTDLGFAIVFTVEAAIRVIADGFFFSPHAYFRSSWGLIDGVVLVTLWLNVLTALLNQGAVSRAVGAFKALRALRLLNISDSARDTFHAVIVRGGWKVLSVSSIPAFSSRVHTDIF